MSIDISPETERLVREEISSGHFRSVDEMIVSGVHAWREKHTSSAGAPATPPNAGGAMLKIDGLWVHEGQAESGADWDRVARNVCEERISDLLKNPPLVNSFFHTSVLVAASERSHPHHSRALPALRKVAQGQDRGFMSAHSIAEVYASLARLPVEPRIPGGFLA